MNIVQVDENAEILIEKDYVFRDRTYTLTNTYKCESVIYAKRADIEIRYIKFKNKYYFVGKYRLEGVCKEDYLRGKEGNGWTYCTTWGNTIHKKTYQCMEKWKDSDGLNREDWPRDKFLNDIIEMYYWLVLRVYSEKSELDIRELDNFTDEIIDILMRDIPGEAV